MLPAVLFTVMTPSATIHFAGDLSCAETHSSRFLPSNRMIASEGGAAHGSPGVTTFGTGCQTSVSSGLAVGAGCCWAFMEMLITTRIDAKRANRWMRMADRIYPGPQTLDVGPSHPGLSLLQMTALCELMRPLRTEVQGLRSEVRGPRSEV